MSKYEMKINTFHKNLKQAIKKLKVKEWEEAYVIILDAMRINPNSPEPHNLLGLWFEMTGKGQLARKHYRVAYVLDPTYKPACTNLERISTIFYNGEIPYDFGDGPDQADQEEMRDRQDVGKSS